MKYILFLLITFLPVEVLGAWTVWTESMLVNKPQPAYNPAIKKTSIALKGAKNEWVGFLLCVRSSESMKGFVPSVVGSLTSGGNSIPNSNILFYLLHNHITTERANTYEVPGAYPDAAVPYKDVYFNEVRNGIEAGWGQTVAANLTRVFFIEIYIPTGTIAGQYTGAVRLTSNNGALTQDIPMTLNVWDFSLPEQWSLKNLWGLYGAYWSMDKTAFGARNDAKAREYLFNLQKAAINHGFFLYGGTARQTSGPLSNNSFTDSHFSGADDTYSWKRFLDGTVPQGHNPKPYPKTSVWGARDEQGTSLILKDIVVMDKWAEWIKANHYNSQTLFFDKIIDEPDLAAINAKHADHISRHADNPDRPMEYWTAGTNSYPKDSMYWGDTFKSVWMVSQFYTWYRAHDWGAPYGSPHDFDARKAAYGDLLFSYTAGDNDAACDIAKYSPSRNIRAAASEAIDAYARQNAYMFISDWHFGTVGHHIWMVNEGWQFNSGGDNANSAWEVTDPFGQYKIDHGWPLASASGYNGSGVYFYPGRVSGTNYDIGGTHEIPIESYRLKLIRWGAQVYEYAKLLETANQKAIADAQIDTFITFNVPNTITIHPVSAWERGREIMGNKIELVQTHKQLPFSLLLLGSRAKR